MTPFTIRVRGTPDRKTVQWHMEFEQQVLSLADLKMHAVPESVDLDMPLEQFLRVMEYLDTFRESICHEPRPNQS